jgi:ABC-type multidrug transport system permease subunit
MNSVWAIYLRELRILRTRLPMLVGSMSVAPLLYIIAFGLALGQDVDIAGHGYMRFLLPGLVALSSMTQAFSIAGEINIARFYWNVFDEIQASPVRDAAYVAGEVLAGATRGVMAALVIVAFGFVFGEAIRIGPLFWLAVTLNSLVFASLAVALAMVVRDHSMQMMLNTFLITPMAFLGGTFFPVDRLPQWAQAILQVLPITHATRIIRSAALDGKLEILPLFILAVMLALLFTLATHRVKRARD